MNRLSRLVGDPAAAHVGLILGGVVDEDVSGHGEIDGLIDPGSATAVAEGVSRDGDVGATALDAHHA